MLLIKQRRLKLLTLMKSQTMKKCIENTYSDEEIDHEENVECQVNLLGLVVSPWDAGLYCVTRFEEFCKHC